MPKRNYGFEKRQKELAKREKREAKALRRRERTAESGDPSPTGQDEALPSPDLEQQ